MKEVWTLLSPWKKFKLIMSIILTILIVIFAIMNWQESEINFIFFRLQIPITLLIVICLVAGYISSSLFDYRKHRLKDKEIQELKGKIEVLELRPKMEE